MALTAIFRQAIYATTPDEVAAACAAFKRKCEANRLDPRDLLVTFPRKRASKRK